MKTVELRNASKPLAHYTAELDSESIVITSNEKPVAALVSLKGMDRESVALSLSPDFAKIIRRARSEAKRGKVFSLDQIKEKLLEATAPNKAMQPSRSAAKPRRVPSARKKRSPRRG
jgi:PHD/YefM family antitoxin component YafN of YafNO toxin-antitoxin module